MKCPKCSFENPIETRFCGNCGSTLSSSEEILSSQTETLPFSIKYLAAGSIFAGRYQVIEGLGKGGMGRVYRVIDKKIDEEVALKFINPEIAVDRKVVERFRNELKIARKITHKNVCRMYDLGEDEKTLYITMEYVSGEDLSTLLKRLGKLPIEKAVSVAGQICEGLAEAHKLGIVHRDLTPRNIMIDRAGDAKIMDFGIARSAGAGVVTEIGNIIGTPSHMSPEQLDGRETDQRSDIYALGILFFEMVTGRAPFEGDTAFSVAIKHKMEKPPNPRDLNSSVPEDLSRLILKCLEKDREKRFLGAEELLIELRKIESEVLTRRKIIISKPLLKKLGAAASVFLLAALCLIGIILFNKSSKVKWAREYAIPKIVRLAQNKDYSAAFQLTRNAERYVPKDPRLAAIWPEISRIASIQTVPSGANISIKDEKAGESAWRFLGQSPVGNIKIPNSQVRLKIEKNGFETLEKSFSASNGLMEFSLDEEKVVSAGIKPFRIDEILQDASGGRIKINAGTDQKIEKGNSGKIFYLKEFGNEKRQWVVAQFVVTEAEKAESTIEALNPKEKIKAGYLVEFDKEIPKASLTIDTEPEGASIYIDDSYRGISDKKIALEPGRHAIRIKKINFQDVIENLDIHPGADLNKDYVLAALSPQSATLNIDSDPSGADVYFGNSEKPAGKTPWKRNLPPQRMSLRIKKENYEEQTREIDLRAGEQFTQTFPLTPKNGRIEIDSIPGGADVYLGESDIPEGKTPLKKDIPPGTYKISIKKMGMEKQEDHLTVHPGELIPLKTYYLNKLSSPTPKYILRIMTSPEGATVTLNNTKYEEKSPVKLELLDSQVNLKIEKEEYKTVEESFNLSQPETPKYYDLKKLGKGIFIIRANPAAKIELDGKPIEGTVPPQKRIEATEGVHTIRFIFEGNIPVDITRSLNEGEELPVHYNLEEHPEVLPKCQYELGAYPSVALEMDGKPHGSIPPVKSLRVNAGPHKMRYLLKDIQGEFVEVEINDVIEEKCRKRINFKSQASSFSAVTELGLPQEYLNDPEKDPVLIKSNQNMDVEMDDLPQGEASSLASLKFRIPQKSKHRLKLKIKRSGENYQTEIQIYKIEKKIYYIIELDIVLLGIK